VKLIGRGLAGVSPALHWVRTQILFLTSQNGLYQRAITPGVQIRSLIVSALEFFLEKTIEREGGINENIKLAKGLECDM
jgi:hypothetical protein